MNHYVVHLKLTVNRLLQEDPPEEGMGTHASILAWRMSWTEESGGLQSMGSHRVGHNRSNLAQINYTSIYKKINTNSLQTLSKIEEGRHPNPVHEDSIMMPKVDTVTTRKENHTNILFDVTICYKILAN